MAGGKNYHSPEGNSPMAFHRLSEHWLFKGLFRPPTGGWLGWAIFGLVILLTIHGFWSDYWLHVPLAMLFGVPEILPQDRTQLAGRLRFVGFIYMIVAPLVAVFVV